MMAYQGNYIPQPMYGNSSGPVNAGHHQQFDPNAYPYPPSTTTAAAAAAPSYIQPAQGPSDAHAQRGPGQAQAQAQGQGQYHVPNQTYGGLPSLMPPPPHVPDDSHFRRAHLQHQHQHQQQQQHQQQRPGDRWPHTGMTEEQRYMQEQYMHNGMHNETILYGHPGITSSTILTSFLYF